jgi:hypothetical protein
MPAGTNTSPNDALTAAVRSLTASSQRRIVTNNNDPDQLSRVSLDTHLLISSLQRSGISFAGAQQFRQGQAVTNATDRRALTAVLSVLLKRWSMLRINLMETSGDQLL